MASSISRSGGYEGSDEILMLDQGGGQLTYYFDFYSIPDRFIVRYAGQTLIDTGFVSNSRSGTVTIPTGTSKQIEVIVATADQGTAWEYRVSAGDCWPTTPLVIDSLGADWGDADNDGNCDLTGTVTLAYGSGGALIRVEGATVEREKDRVTFTGGRAYALIGQNVPLLLVDGSFDMAYATGLSSNVHSTTISLAGIPLKVDQIQIQANEIAFSYELDLLSPFDDVILRVLSPVEYSSLRLTANGWALGKGAGATLPDIKGFDFFGFFTADMTKLSLSTDPAGTELKMRGEVTTKSPVRGQKLDTVTLNLAGDNYIAITNQPSWTVDVKGELKIAANWELMKGWALEEVSLTLDTKAGTIGGTTGVRIPLGVKLDLGLKASFDFAYKPEWALNGLGLDLSLTGGGLPIPALPWLYLYRVAGGIKNIAPSVTDPVEYNGGLGFTLLPGASFFHLARFTLDGTLKEGQAVSGTLSGVFGEFGGVALATITGATTYDYAKGSIKGSLDFDFLEALNGRVALTVGKAGAGLNGRLAGTIPTEVKLPFLDDPVSVPLIGGKQLAGAAVIATYSDDGTLADDSIAVWGTVALDLGVLNSGAVAYNLVAGLKVGFDGSWEVIGANNVPQEVTPTLLRVAARSLLTAAPGRFTVDQPASLLMLQASWTTPQAGPVALRVITPDGTTLEEADFATHGIIAGGEFDGPGGRTVSILDPAQGTWTLQVAADASGLGTVAYDAWLDGADPVLTLATPTPLALQGWDFGWSVANAPQSLQMSFYADTDADGFDGLLIGSFSLSGTFAGDFSWDGAGVEAGDYYVYAVATGGQAIPSEAYAPGGPVHVDHEADLAVSLTTTQGTPDTGLDELPLVVRVTNQGGREATGARLTLDLPQGFVLASGANADGNGVSLDLGTIAAGATVEQLVVADRAAALQPGLFTFGATVSALTADPDASNNQATLPVAFSDAALRGFDLRMWREGLDQTVPFGANLTYRLAITNDGADPAASFSVTELLQNARAVAAQVVDQGGASVSTYASSYNGDYVSVSGYNLAPGATVLLDITVTPYGTATVTATATASGSGGVGEAFNADNSLTGAIGAAAPGAVAEADLSLALTPSATTALVGDQLTYDLVLTNAGPGAASAIAVRFDPGAGVTIDSASSVQGTYDPATRIWTVGNISNGISRTLHVTATVAARGLYQPTAEIVAVAEPDPDSAIGNGAGEDDFAQTSLLVGPNDTPAGSPDAYRTDAAGTISVGAAQGLLANDTDPDGDPLHAVLASGPSHGRLTLAADGSFQYVATGGYLGLDSFTYTPADFSLTGAPVTVSLTVTASAPGGAVVPVDDFLRAGTLAAAQGGGIEWRGPQGTIDLSGAGGAQFADGLLNFDPSGAVAVIARLYEGLLGREGAAAELGFWLGQSAAYTLDGVAQLIAASPEAARPDTADDASFVTSLYHDLLGRAPGTGEAQVWTDALAHGSSRGAIGLSFATSAEATAADAQAGRFAVDPDMQTVSNLYDAALDRNGEKTGLLAWQALLQQGASPGEIAQGFTGSAEYLARTQGLSDVALVDQTYRAALDRAPDGAGMQGWLVMLATGGTRTGLIEGFLASPEYQALAVQRTAAGVGFD